MRRGRAEEIEATMAEVVQAMSGGRHRHCTKGAAGGFMQTRVVKRARRQTATACTHPADAVPAANAREKRADY